MSSKPTVTVNLTIFVGSRHEGYGETGMAHLLEHMVFKGTPTHPDSPQGAAGARRPIQRHHLGRPHQLLRDHAGHATTTWSSRCDSKPTAWSTASSKREDLISEMTVVRNEFERGENSPGNAAQPADDGRRLRVAQLRQDRRSATAPTSSACRSSKLQAFYNKYYQPDNAMLVVAGKFDEAKALELIEKYFGAIPKPEAQARQDLHRRAGAGRRTRSVTLRRVGDVGAGRMRSITFRLGRPSRYRALLECSADVLDSAPSGRLYKALVETAQGHQRRRRRGAAGTTRACSKSMPKFAKATRSTTLRDIMLDSHRESRRQDRSREEEVERAKQQILKAARTGGGRYQRASPWS